MLDSLMFHLAFLRAHLESDENIEELLTANLAKLIADCEDCGTEFRPETLFVKKFDDNS